MSTAGPEKPMRRDALRSRARILEAAAVLFAEVGLSATLNDVARHAGVGVGTVYRHFPDREELIDTLLEERVETLVTLGQEALADPDAWHGLVTALERGLQVQASDRGLRELIHASPAGLERGSRVRERLFPMVGELVHRAQRAGAVRGDIDPTDIPLMQVMIVAVMDASRDVDPGLWRRYLALALRGIAADPDSLPPLPATSLSPEDFDRVMTAAPTLRR